MPVVDVSLPTTLLIIATALMLSVALKRLSQIETQLRDIEGMPDAAAIRVIAGCMLRGRACRGAVIALYLALASEALGLLVCGIGCTLGITGAAYQAPAMAVAAGLICLSSGLLLVDARGSLETTEHIARRQLAGQRRLN